MKKLIALILVCLICLTSAYAAEWREGLSPAKPSTHSQEADFSKNLGYLIAWPRPNMPAQRFCDVLEIYMPRDDLALGEGKISLCDSSGVVAEMDCADPAQVELRPLEESELEQLMWGSGSCLDVHLPISLEFNKEDYYVMMDEGVLFDPANGVKNPPMGEHSEWHPLLKDDFGVSRLYYAKGVEKPADEEEDEDAPKEKAEEPVEYTYRPTAGDTVTFDLVLGGDAKEAIIFSENDSVYFSPFQFTESGTITGDVTGEDVNWGIVFLDGEGKQLDQLTLRRGNVAEAAEAGN